MKYIDAEKLIRLLDAKYKDFMGKSKTEGYTTLQYQYMADGIDIAEQLIDSLQQEQQEKKEVKFVFPKFLYARTTNNKTIDVSYAPQSLDAVEYIRSDFLQQEQPEVDLEQEISSYFKGWTETDEGIAADAEWQKAKMLKDNPVIMSVEDFQALIDSHAKRVEADYKEKMLKEAKDGYVSGIIIHNDGDEVHYAVTYPNGKRPHSITDKVKIIIVKEEE